MLKIAYYIHQWPYTKPPAEMRRDMEWMRGCGFDAVAVTVCELDLEKYPVDIDRVVALIREYGMKPFLVPSRWGGLVAGAVGVKSYFSAAHDGALMRRRDGSAVEDPLWGRMASVHSPETIAFYQETLDVCMRRWHFDGIIWDEPKAFDLQDFSEHALAKRGADDSLAWDRRMFANFFDEIGAYVKQNYPGTRLSMFIYAHLPQDIMDLCTAIEHLDDFGIDGNPFRQMRKTEKNKKTLLGNAEKIAKACRKAGKNSLILIENFDLLASETREMDKNLPEILASGVDVVMAYYYGRNNEDPDAVMEVTRRHLRAL